MEIKYNQSNWRSALVAGLFLSCGTALEATVDAKMAAFPLCFSKWTDEQRADGRIAIGTSIAIIDKRSELVDSFVKGKSFNPNQRVLVAISVPLIFLAATATGSSDNHPLNKLLEQDDTIIFPQLASGDTPLHWAAANSDVATGLLLSKKQVDVNEFNRAGETSLYVAMRYNKSSSHIDSFIRHPDFLINAVDNFGRTMLHTAVRQGDSNVVQQILNLKNLDNGHTLDVNIKDADGKTPADYLEGIDDIDARAAIQLLLSETGATYGKGGKHIISYSGVDTYAFGNHDDDDARVPDPTAEA